MEKPRYKALRRTMISRKGLPPLMFEPGRELEFDGLPGSNLEPLNDAARKRQEEAEAAFSKQRREAAMRATPQGEAIAEALAELLAGAVQRRAPKAKAEAA